MNHHKSKGLILLCLLLCISLSGCQQKSLVASKQQEVIVMSTDAPQSTSQIAGVQPANVLDAISTTDKVVSIVFEGHTEDLSTFKGLVEVLKANHVPAMFFLSAAAVSDCPDGVTLVSQNGYEIGNYGISAHAQRETYLIDENLHFFEKSQEVLSNFFGKTPKYFRCSDTQYIDELLQTATLAGLQAGVLPSTFLNHRSFQDETSAAYFVENLVRGSVISIKVGQELALSEYENVGEKLDEKPAIDKEAGIANMGLNSNSSWNYEQVIDTTKWLLDALKADGYQVLSLEALQNKDMHFYDDPIDLSQAQVQLYDAYEYAIPRTDVPLGAVESAQVPPTWFEDALFIGDESMVGFHYYAQWISSQNAQTAIPKYFNATAKMSVKRLLASFETGETLFADDAPDFQKIYIGLGYHDIASMTPSAFIDNLKIALYECKKQAPNATFYIQSILPRVASQTATPSNERIFTFNLALAKFCEEQNLVFVDVAFALKDDHGDLQSNLCSDAQVTGRVLTDEGYQMWLSYLLMHTTS